MTDIGYQHDSFSVGVRWRMDLEGMDDVTAMTT